ncbi:hypothetical protein EGI11_03330 [Chryseobacterium sp. H3056]|uniref:Uncharacterized protein n=1 Tax=Kaistella daneshvariae TaxID=2487074 RepID=A0A3N0WXU1_9FLAO|nr:hypothetical protein [Kaistella daneshvariae]ROI09803.1 hypothetical protein EGI11_03330 [Kaistella daneshvariae]
MNIIDYNQSGGFPMSTQILEAAQDAYKTFNEYGKLAGELVIISGCETINIDQVADGFVSINGELLPFKSASVSEFVVIVQNSDLRGFEDGSAKPVIYTRYATFGSSPTQFEWAKFRRPQTLLMLEDRLTKLEMAVPIGLVAIWDKPESEIPLGWEEHIELAGRTPVGLAYGDVNFGTLGGNLGAAQVTLSINEIPQLNFGWTGLNGTGYPNASGDSTTAGTVHSYVRQTQNLTKGGGQSHSNIQPSRIVKFIRFKGFL